MLLFSMKRVFLVIAACAFLLTTSSIGCKDPDEYAPPEDTLIPPPGPPQLLTPIDHYVLMDPTALPWTSFYIPVTLSWDTVCGAEAYVLELTMGNLPPIIKTTESNGWFFLIHDDATKLCDYRWRVRAGSTQWDGMTDWSEEWHFEARLRPFAPLLLSPVDSSIITADTLPAPVELFWETVYDEQFYSVKICKDAQLVDSICVYTNMLEYYVEETGTYSWQVWAGSPLWQYPSFPSATYYFTIKTR